jgi:hypothetical protein
MSTALRKRLVPYFPMCSGDLARTHRMPDAGEIECSQHDIEVGREGVVVVPPPLACWNGRSRVDRK